MKAENVKQATALPGLFAIGATFAASVRAEMNAEELAKLAQNPVGNLTRQRQPLSVRHAG